MIRAALWLLGMVAYSGWVAWMDFGVGGVVYFAIVVPLLVGASMVKVGVLK